MARFAHKILGNNDIGWNLQLESLAAPVPVYVDAHFSILSSYRTELAIQGAPLVRLPDETLPMGTGFKWNHRMDFDAATTGTHTFSLPVKAAADRENFTVLGGEVLNYMFTIAYDIGAGPGISLQCTSPMYTMNGQGSLVQQQLQQQQVEKEWE